jgi:ESCRT-II complex subunit VPS36
MDLSYVTQTDYYAGLFKSSPKITLYLSTDIGPSFQTANSNSEPGFESWECEVCGYRNPPGLSPAAARLCGLCGVPRPPTSMPTSALPSQHLLSSLPPSAASSSPSLSSPTADDDSGIDEVACPTCTFLNYPSLRVCEMCSTELPQVKNPRAQRGMKSAPSSRTLSPEPDDEGHPPARLIKLSFRKGGDKLFYMLFKRSLKAKTWEVCSMSIHS